MHILLERIPIPPSTAGPLDRSFVISMSQSKIFHGCVGLPQEKKSRPGTIRARMIIGRFGKLTRTKLNSDLEIDLKPCRSLDPSESWTHIPSGPNTECVLKRVSVFSADDSFPCHKLFEDWTKKDEGPLSRSVSTNGRRVRKEIEAVSKITRHQSKEILKDKRSILQRGIVVPHAVTLDLHSNIMGSMKTFTFVSQAVRYPDMVSFWRKCHDTSSGSLLGSRRWSSIFSSFKTTIMTAVKFLHNAGVYHTDLTPQNVLVHPLTGSAVICDFDSAVTLEECDYEHVTSKRLRELGAYDIRSQKSSLPPECICLCYSMDPVGWVRSNLSGISTWNPARFFAAVDAFQVGILLFVMGAGVPPWSDPVYHSGNFKLPKPRKAVQNITGLPHFAFLKRISGSWELPDISKRADAVLHVSQVYAKQMGQVRLHLTESASQEDRVLIANLLAADPRKRLYIKNANSA